MNSIVAFSSITRKTFLAIIGVFLLLFLPMHLSVNLMLLKNDGGVAFQEAVHLIAANPMIKLLEFILFSAFLLHIVFAFLVSGQNKAARPTRYVCSNKTETSFFSKYMLHTGVIVLLFLGIHIFDFYAKKIGLVATPNGVGREDFYHQALILFSQPLPVFIYVVSFVGVGFHLNHAVQSAFQTLGLSHGKYTPIVKTIGTVYALLITAGFSVIPICLYLFQ